jgi:saccharopine dehydrogenase (NAD+, L-lysine-forming)
MGEGTGIPAALGTILMATDGIDAKGVVPPEAAVEPGAFFGLLVQTMGGDGPGLPVRVARSHEGGPLEEVPAEGLLALLTGG